ncbi:hypothetical protein GIB67_035215 [Kingdonia uniflora]|uniref:Uncharacterized protein n=1 Tax=Kingdonia uniflora TaxID=39325 RepID=A0A7J7KXZ5_9MAGN|nr:hypothetical protein GIB67_035215 [Kingdonia uniflora]
MFFSLFSFWKWFQIPEDWPYQEARRLFKEPLVSSEDQQLEIKWTAPDEEAIEKIKAAKNKSAQGRLESFFKPVVSSSVPLKRKVCIPMNCPEHI